MRGFMLMLYAGVASAQVVAPLEAGNTEIGAFGGLTGGLGRTGAGVGGNIAVAAQKFVMPYAEVTYFPNIFTRSSTDTLQFPGTTLRGSSDLSFTDFHAGLHFRYRLKTKTNLVPYGVLGAGMLRNDSTSTRLTGRTPEGRDVDTTVAIPARTAFSANFGAGLRWYVSEHFGTRFEVKGYRPSSSFSDPFFKLTFGIFYYIR